MNQEQTANDRTSNATLFYDGACPLCTKEIRRLSELCDGDLCLVDIHSVEHTDTLPGKETLLRDLHYIGADGTVLTGIDANVEAWQHTRFGFLWRWLRWSWLRPLTSRAYALWARRRFRNLYGDSPSVH